MENVTGPIAEQEERRNKKTRQNNKRAGRNVKSNDSPEIPDRRWTSDIRGLSLKGCKPEEGGWRGGTSHLSEIMDGVRG